jgi:hypothetical protein
MIFDSIIEKLTSEKIGVLKDILEHLKKFLMKNLPQKLDMCYGNYLGLTLVDEEQEGALEQCTNMPLKSDGVFGNVSFTLDINEIKVNICIVFNKHNHTYAISISGDSIATVLQFIFPGISDILNFIDYIGIGISIKESSFEKEINVLNPIHHGNSVKFSVANVKVPGNFYINAGFKLPDDYLKFGGFDMSEYISLKASGLIMMGLEKAAKNTMTQNFENSLNEVITNKDKTINNILSQVNGSNEFNLLINGDSEFELDIEDISFNYIPKLTLKIADFNVYWNYPKAFYISYEGQDILDQLREWMQKIFSNYKKLTQESEPASCTNTKKSGKNQVGNYFYLTIINKGLFIKFNLFQNKIKFKLHFTAQNTLIFAISVNKKVLYSGEISGRVLKFITVGMDLIDRGLSLYKYHPVYSIAQIAAENFPKIVNEHNDGIERQTKVNQQGWEELKCFINQTTDSIKNLFTKK